MPADIDETPRRNESPRALAQRLSAEKAAIAAGFVARRADLAPVADARRRHRGLRRPPHPAEMRDPRRGGGLPRAALRARPSRLYRADAGARRRRARGIGWSRRGVRFKRLSRDEINAYLGSGEWRGKAGGYAIQGLAGAFVVRADRLLHQRRRPAAGRDGGAARRRGLFRPSPAGRREPDRWPRTTIDRPRTGPLEPKTPSLRRSAASRAIRLMRPFCSRRCADVDLHRWLKGSYVIPGSRAPEADRGDDE